MALDTFAKRASAINVSLPWRRTWPIPDGTLDAQDRAEILALYAGISFVATTNGTLDATEGADSAALVGNVPISGTLAATEGADADDSAGTVLVQGALAATEGADVAAFVATLVVSAALAATEGADSAAFAGNVVVSGTLAATEGADVAAFSGQVIVSGTLAVTEGADSDASAGMVIVSGTLAVTEGADTAHFDNLVETFATLAATEGADGALFVGARPTRVRQIKDPVWLLEFQAYLTADVTLDTGVRSSGLNTFYFAGPGGITTRADDTPASTVYEPRLMQDLGIVVRSAFGDDNANTGKPPVNGGFFRIANADGKFDFLRTSGVGGRPFYLKRLADRDDPVSTAETVFVGNCRGWASEEMTQSLMLRVRDKLEALETQFLSDTYGGTVSGSSASIDGTASMAGKLKPYALGRNYQLEGLPVNPFDRIYQGAKNAQDAIFVSDGGLPLTKDSDYATIALLRAATIASGHYATCLAQAAWRLGADPGKVVHAELRSHALTAPEMSAGLVAEAVLLASGVSSGDIDHSSFAALSLTGSTVWQVGLYVDDNRSTFDIVCEVLNSLGATITATPLGKIKCCPIGMPYQTFSDYGAAQPNVADSVRTFTFRDAAKGSSFQLKPSPAAEGDGVRAKFVTIRSQKRHRVLSATEINSSASADTRFLVQREFLDLTQVSAISAVATIEPNAAWLKFDTLLSDATGAIFEGTRRATFYGESRDRISLSMPRSSAKRDSDGSDIDLGDTVTVQVDRFGYEGGRPFYVTKRTDNFGADSASLELLG